MNATNYTIEPIGVITFAICCKCGWHIRMAAVAELGHQLLGDRLLGLVYLPPDAQTGVHIQSYAAPEAAARVAFRIAPFSPLLPT
jgi:hypothetical protein